MADIFSPDANVQMLDPVGKLFADAWRLYKERFLASLLIRTNDRYRETHISHILLGYCSSRIEVEASQESISMRQLGNCFEAERQVTHA